MIDSLVDHLPAWATASLVLGVAAWQWLGLVIALVSAFAVGHALARLLLLGGARLAAFTQGAWDDDVVVSLRRPLRLAIAVLLLGGALVPLRLPPSIGAERLVVIALVGAAAWIATALVGVLARAVERRASASAAAGDVAAAAHSRGVKTQVAVLRRIASIVIAVVATAIALLQFEVVRSVGISLLASAGVAGVVVGLAAQRSIAGLLGGLQLSIAQPVRIGDTVIIENEWGTIEEIHLTYVVVRVWDERRLVVPVSRFLETPFQNWTRSSNQLLGTVFLYADPPVPVAAMREELSRIVKDHPMWDGRVSQVVVTDVKEQSVELRALVSARNAGDLWDLRCDVREKLVHWLAHHEGGRFLPRYRHGPPMGG